MIFVFLTVAPEGRETNLLEQKGELPRCHPLCSAGQFVEGIWKVGDLSFEDGERRKVGFDGSCDGPQRLHLTHILQTPHQRHRLQACPVSLSADNIPLNLRGSYHLSWLQGTTGLWCLDRGCKDCQAAQRRHQ